MPVLPADIEWPMKDTDVNACFVTEHVSKQLQNKCVFQNGKSELQIWRPLALGNGSAGFRDLDSRMQNIASVVKERLSAEM